MRLPKKGEMWEFVECDKHNHGDLAAGAWQFGNANPKLFEKYVVCGCLRPLPETESNIRDEDYGL